MRVASAESPTISHACPTLVDEIDLGPVAMLAMSCGGPPAISFAARHPDRVSKLVLFGSYADGSDIAPADFRAAIVALVRSTSGSVGSRTLADIFMPAADRSEVAEYARYQRAVSTPDLAADLLQMTFDMGARAEASLVRRPVLVLDRTGDRAVHPRCGRALAALIPAADIVELDGSGHSMNEGDSRALVREVEQFLLGYSSVEYVARRLATILFTDIVGSTTMATELGDGAWRMRLDEHDRTTRAAVEHHAGRVVKTTVDGVLAARGDDIVGIAVNVAARIQSTAVSGTKGPLRWFVISRPGRVTASPRSRPRNSKASVAPGPSTRRRSRLSGCVRIGAPHFNAA